MRLADLETGLEVHEDEGVVGVEGVDDTACHIHPMPLSSLHPSVLQLRRHCRDQTACPDATCTPPCNNTWPQKDSLWTLVCRMLPVTCGQAAYTTVL